MGGWVGGWMDGWMDGLIQSVSQAVNQIHQSVITLCMLMLQIVAGSEVAPRLRVLR